MECFYCVLEKHVLWAQQDFFGSSLEGLPGSDGALGCEIEDYEVLCFAFSITPLLHYSRESDIIDTMSRVRGQIKAISYRRVFFIFEFVSSGCNLAQHIPHSGQPGRPQ